MTNANGFKKDFGSYVRATEIHVTIVIRSNGFKNSYGVYVCHGHPGGQYWKNSAPLVSCETIEEAKEKAETIYGIAGSAEYAMIVTR